MDHNTLIPALIAASAFSEFSHSPRKNWFYEPGSQLSKKEQRTRKAKNKSAKAARRRNRGK